MEHLPPWLRNAPLPARPPSRDAAADDASPEWLRGVAPPATSPAGSSLDWLPSVEPEPSPGEDAAHEQIPAWLRDLQVEVEKIEESRDQPEWLSRPVTEEPSRASETPAWLLADEDAEQENTADVPDWLREPMSPQKPPIEPPPRPSVSGATSWLSSLGADQGADQLAADVAADLPDQSDAQPQAPRRVQMPIGATDWLRSIGQEPDLEPETGQQSPEASGPAPSAERPGANDAESGIPDWLRDVSPSDVEKDIAAVESETQPARKQFSASEAPEPFDSGQEIPDWLRSESLAAQSASPSAGGADVPAWLEEATADESAAQADRSPDERERLGDRAHQESSRSPTDVPAWLQSLDQSDHDDDRTSISSDSGGETLPSWLTADVDSEAKPADSGNVVPDWLRGTEPTVDRDQKTASEQAVPAWLNDAEAAAPASEAKSDIPEWLQGATDETPVGSGPSAPAEEIPAWLRDADREPSGVPGDTEEIPAWLRDEDREPATVIGETEEIPTWLRDADRESSETPSDTEEIPAWLREADRQAEAPGSSSEDSNMPAWLQNAEDAAPSVAPQTPEASDDVPAWLRAAREEPNEQAAPPVKEDMPKWLQGDASLPSVSSGSTESPQMPSWLQAPSSEPKQAPAAPDLPPWLGEEPQESGLPRVVSNDESLPLWLRGADREAASPEQPSAGFSGENDVAEAGSPTKHEKAKPSAWLSSVEPSVARTKRDDEESADFFGGADLPDWLRVPEPEPAPQTEDTRALDWLSRLGVHDDDNEGVAVATASSVAVLPQPTYTRSPAQREAIALLQRLVAVPYPETAPKAKPAPPSVWERIGLERILYVALIVAVLAGIAFPQLSGTLQTATPMAPGASDLAVAIDRLSDEDIVLLAYEWDAERSSELAPLEDAVTAHLIERKAKLLLVSTDPQGTLLSFDLRDELQAAGYNPTIDGVSFGGRDYVLLGYQPGGELALRRMAQDLRAVLRSDFEGRDATRGGLATNFDGTPRLSTLDDLDLIVVMADQPLDVQAWMEQIHSRATQVPIAFLVPSETQPLVQPYLRGDNVLHLAGKQGALAYTAQENTATTANIAQDTGRQNFAIAVFVALLIIGGGAGALLRLRRSPRSE